MHYLDGPAAIALPPQLYDAYVEFRWLGHVTPRLGYDVAVTPAVDSDFRQHSSHALRITGHGIAAWTWLADAHAGARRRLPRPHRRAAVAGGRPGLEAQRQRQVRAGVSAAEDFPSRLLERHRNDQDIQDWVYIGGELGGGTWAIQRGDGASDVLNYRDLRVFLGIERKAFGRISPRFEVGYVFSRKLQLDQAADRFRAARHSHGPRRAWPIDRRGCESVPLALPALPCFHPSRARTGVS